MVVWAVVFDHVEVSVSVVVSVFAGRVVVTVDVGPVTV